MSTAEQDSLRFLREAEKAADQAHAQMKDAGLECTYVRVGRQDLEVIDLVTALQQLYIRTDEIIEEQRAEAAREDAESCESGDMRTPPRE